MASRHARLQASSSSMTTGGDAPPALSLKELGGELATRSSQLLALQRNFQQLNSVVRADKCRISELGASLAAAEAAAASALGRAGRAETSLAAAAAEPEPVPRSLLPAPGTRVQTLSIAHAFSAARSPSTQAAGRG